MVVLAGSAWAQAGRPETRRAAAEPSPRTSSAATSILDLEGRTSPRYVSPDLLETVVDPETYVLGPQDLLVVQLILGESRVEQLPVLPEGVVIVPNVGAVHAAGLTLAAFRKRLQNAVGERYRSFELYCHLAKPRQFRVYVTGEVREPGVLAARASDRVSDAIERAGGLAEGGSKRDIEVRDAAGQLIARADLAAFERRGRLDANPFLAAGNVLFVASRRRSVQIEGAVASPGDYEWKPGESLEDVLALAGGLLPVADRTRVSVERVGDGGRSRVEVIGLDADLRDAADVRRIVVHSHLVGQPRVFVVGPDGVQRTSSLQAGETLRDLVLRVGTLTPDADWNHAELATRSATGQPERLRVDIPRVLAGEGDRPLQDGDLLAVSRLPDFVYVSGFVSRPGRFPYRADWSASDYIGEAGGPAAGGSTGNVRIYDAAGRVRDADRKSALQRGETLYLDRSFTGKASSALGLVANLSALVISIVALNR
jgi:protein involved in polysaccharide export with SLBB domain